MIILSPIGLLMREATDDVAQPLEDLGDVALRPRLQRRVDQPAVLHAREVGRALLRRRSRSSGGWMSSSSLSISRIDLRRGPTAP